MTDRPPPYRPPPYRPPPHRPAPSALISRRRLLALSAAAGVVAAVTGGRGRRAAAAGTPLMRPIHSTGLMMPAVGLGTWITFNVGNDPEAIAGCTAVMKAFFEAGGRMIDSSPMYGSAQMVVGRGLDALGRPQAVYAADKVWISSGDDGPDQIAQSRALWGVPQFDLMQVHNLRGWEAHLETLFAMKAAGRLTHVGITTSEGRRHDTFEQVMASQPLDTIQITYNILDRAVEDRILPLARERGQAVIVNRPFRQGGLTRRLAREPLPGWAAEIGAGSWAQALLKFILSHPDITCAIPATTRVDHMRENLDAARGPLPDAALRRRMIADVEAI